MFLYVFSWSITYLSAYLLRPATCLGQCWDVKREVQFLLAWLELVGQMVWYRQQVHRLDRWPNLYSEVECKSWGFDSVLSDYVEFPFLLSRRKWELQRPLRKTGKQGEWKKCAYRHGAPRRSGERSTLYILWHYICLHSSFFFFRIVFIHSFIHSFIRERHIERQRHRQRERQASSREPDVWNSIPEPWDHDLSQTKADAQPLSHSGVPTFKFPIKRLAASFLS